MSIRHVELLKHVRPVLQFIAEHSAALFRLVGPSRFIATTGAGRPQSTAPLAAPLGTLGRPRSSSSGEDSDSDVSINRGSGYRRGPPGSASDGGAKLSSSAKIGSHGLIKPPYLSLHAHMDASANMMDMDTGVEEQGSLSSTAPLHAPLPNYSSWEWRVLEALACSRVQHWLARSGGAGGWGAGGDEHKHTGSHRTEGRKVSSSSPVQCLQSGRREGGGLDDLRLYDSDEEEYGRGGRDSDSHPSASAKKGQGQGEGQGSGSGARTAGGCKSEERRRLISECKNLRQEVLDFLCICMFAWR